MKFAISFTGCGYLRLRVTGFGGVGSESATHDLGNLMGGNC